MWQGIDKYFWLECSFMGAIAVHYNASAHGTNNHRSTTRLLPTAPMKLSWAL